MSSRTSQFANLFAALVLSLGLLNGSLIANAQTDSNPAQAYEKIISSQIDAFRRDAGTEAFSFASPTIRRMFGTADNFMQMVQKGYPQVYRPQSFKFGKVTTEMDGRPTQRVHITDMAGRSWTALYAFELQGDGTWRIAGVVVVRETDVSA